MKTLQESWIDGINKIDQSIERNGFRIRVRISFSP